MKRVLLVLASALVAAGCGPESTARPNVKNPEPGGCVIIPLASLPSDSRFTDDALGMWIDPNGVPLAYANDANSAIYLDPVCAQTDGLVMSSDVEPGDRCAEWPPLDGCPGE